MSTLSGFSSGERHHFHGEMVHRTHNVNTIAAALNHNNIRSIEDLTEKKIRSILTEFNRQSNNYVKNHKSIDVFSLFKEGLVKYSNITESTIKLKNLSETKFKRICENIIREDDIKVNFTSKTDEKEIEKFEDSYDRFAEATSSVETRSQQLSKHIRAHDFPFVPHLVLGAGDAATEYWLDHCKDDHNTTDKKLAIVEKNIPNTLLIAKDTGNWKHDYTLAQTHSLLERVDAPINPEQFATKKQYEENRHVNARHLYQSNLISMNETEAPVLLGISVTKVEKKANHAIDWKESTAEYRVLMKMHIDQQEVLVPVQGKPSDSEEDKLALTQQSAEQIHNSSLDKTQILNNEYFVIRPKLDENDKPNMVDGKMVFVKEKFINKSVYTDTIEICSGLGIARELAPSQIDKDTFARLSQLDPKKGYTPLCDGNTFMLTSREEHPISRDIVIYGGGGNATACYRKAFFRFDVRAEDKVYTSNNQYPKDLHWFSRDGFEDAGYGRLAKMATNFAQNNDQLHTGNLVHIEEDKNGKIHLFFEDSKGTYEQKPVTYSAAMEQSHPKKIITKAGVDKSGAPISQKFAVREFICDQLVYSIGQNSSDLRGITQEIEKDLQLHAYNVGTGSQAIEVPVGVKTKDDKVRLWGGVAAALSPWEMDSAAAKEVNRYNHNTRNWIVIRKLARDAEWPGVMPPSRTQIKYTATVSQQRQGGQPLQSVNLNIDDFIMINAFLKDQGIDDAQVRHDFLEDLLRKREEAHINLQFAGVPKNILADLIMKHKLENTIEIKGHGSLVRKN